VDRDRVPHRRRALNWQYVRVAEDDSFTSEEQGPAQPTSRDLFEVVGVTNASSNVAVATLVSFIRSVAMVITGGLIPETPKSKVRVVDRGSQRVLVEYDYGHDLAGASEHVRQLNERLDQQTPDEFIHGLGLTEIPALGA
jgi:hypothetical protein